MTHNDGFFIATVFININHFTATTSILPLRLILMLEITNNEKVEQLQTVAENQSCPHGAEASKLTIS